MVKASRQVSMATSFPRQELLMLRRRCCLLLFFVALAGCAGPEAVAPSRLVAPSTAPSTSETAITPADFSLGSIVNQDLQEITVGADETIGRGVERIGLGHEKDAIRDCYLSSPRMWCDGFTQAMPWPLMTYCFIGSCGSFGGPCGNVAVYPIGGNFSACNHLEWVWEGQTGTPPDPGTSVVAWSRASTWPTAQGRNVFWIADGNFYVFDHWISTTPCIEGTQTGLTCTFSFTMTNFGVHHSDWGVVPVYRLTIYRFGGFLPPISPADVNVAKAGSSVPVKFSLGDSFGLGVLAAESPASNQVTCQTATATSSIDATSTAGASGLTYDATTGLYTYIWKTEKAWAGTCRELTLTLLDGQAFTASFQFAK